MDIQRLCARLVPARYRSLARVYFLEKRCDARSSCAKQATELVSLLEEMVRTGEPGEEAVWVEACVALLDQPNRYLSTRRTAALAFATLHEAMLQAQQDRVMKHELDRMKDVLARLEHLERRVSEMEEDRLSSHRRMGKVSLVASIWGRGGGGGELEEEEEQALLQHLGRGIELLRQRRSAAIW